MTSALNGLFNPVPALAEARHSQGTWAWGMGIGPLTAIYGLVDDALMEAEPDWWDVEIDDHGA